MKKLAVLLIIFFVYVGTFAQTYTLKSGSGSYYPLGSSASTLASSYTSTNTYTLNLGFNFTFFGKTYSQVTVSSNGKIYVGSGYIDAIGASLESKSSLSSKIRYLSGGTTGSRYMIVEWYQTGFSADKTNDDYISFSITMSEYDGTINLNYGLSSTLYSNYFTNSAPTVHLQSPGSGSYYVDKYYNLSTSFTTMGGVPSYGDYLTFTYSPKAAVTITNPIKNASWKANTAYDIMWDYTDLSNVDIDISYDGGTTYNTVAHGYSASIQDYRFTTPKLTKSDSNCIIRIADASNSSHTSSVHFYILAPDTAPHIKIINPASSFTTAYVGDKVTIQWRKSNVTSSVKLYYSVNSGVTWKTIAAPPAADSIYNWTVPNDTGKYCKVEVVSATDPSVHDISSFFSIKKKPLPKAISFYPSEKLGTNLLPRLFAGDTFNINWMSQSVDRVNIYLILGFNQNTIVENIANTNTYVWAVPNIDITGAKLMVTDYPETIYAESSPFDISTTKPTLKLTSPIGGEVLQASGTANITWQANHVPMLDVWVTYDGWRNYTKVGSGINGYNGGYSFTLPNISSTQCAVEIIDLNNILKIWDVSANFFEITQHNSGIRESPGESSFTLFPNPGNGVFNVKFSKDFSGSVMVLNSLGQTLWTKAGVKANTGEIIEAGILLQPGLYYVKFKGQDGEISQPLMVR
jgi:hypothetical protein